jgi:hypothetical protein
VSTDIRKKIVQLKLWIFVQTLKKRVFKQNLLGKEKFWDE